MRDTPPDITHKMSEMIQSKSPFEHLAMGNSMYETSRYLIIRHILENNPNISHTALLQELFLKFYGNDFSPEQKRKILIHLE